MQDAPTFETHRGALGKSGMGEAYRETTSLCKYAHGGTPPRLS